MTPKEKAKELFEKFTKASEPKIATLCWDEQEEVAQQCALITVNEIISMQEQVNIRFDFNIKYWQEVKTELEKL